MINVHVYLRTIVDLTVVCGALFLLPCSAAAGRRADFGQQWVRTHPFTLNAMETYPTSAAAYEAAGFTSSLSYYDQSILDLHAARNQPWHLILQSTSLADAQTKARTAIADTQTDWAGLLSTSRMLIAQHLLNFSVWH